MHGLQQGMAKPHFSPRSLNLWQALEGFLRNTIFGLAGFAHTLQREEGGSKTVVEDRYGDSVPGPRHPRNAGYDYYGGIFVRHLWHQPE